MSDKKICDFCGEPITGGLQEHDFATCAHSLRDRVIKLEAELKKYVKANIAGQAKNERLIIVIERIKERAERVSEGEDWDLGEYCIEVIDNAIGEEDGEKTNVHVFSSEADSYVAETLEQVLEMERQMCGGENPTEEEDWSQCADDAEIMIWLDDVGEIAEHGMGVLVVGTCRDWAGAYGSGFLC